MANLCGSAHPTLPIFCNRPGEGSKSNHPEHTSLSYNNFVDWPNESFEQPEPKRVTMTRKARKPNALLKEIAERIKT